MKIVIAGYGVEGVSNLRYFQQKFPEAQLIIASQNTPANVPAGVEVRTGDSVFTEQLADADMVVRSPSIAPQRIKTSGKIWSATNEFFATCPTNHTIGVTGTKGKGTTCSLITSLLRAAGKTVHLLGNIGVPALDVVEQIQPDDYVVYELSSFQLWDLERSPDLAVVLMIEPDHLDVHGDFAVYLDAKKNIRRHQTVASRGCIYHPTNKYSRDVAMTPPEGLGSHQLGDQRPAGSLRVARRYAVPDDEQVYIDNGFFCQQGQQICSVDHLKLPGAHNLENSCAAISAVMSLGLPLTAQQVAAGLEGFSGLPHRLKRVAQVRGVAYYDDSIATTPGSAIAALRAFAAPKVLILGGSDKGADYAELAGEVAQQAVRAVIVTGDNAGKIARALDQAKVAAPVLVRQQATMSDIVAQAAAVATEGDVVILSPAAASFGMYKSYVERGERFVAAVAALSEGA